MAPGQAEASVCSASESGPFRLVDPARLLDSIGDLIIVLDGGGSIKAVNAAARSMFGIAAARMIGKPLFDFLHIAEQAAYLEALQTMHSGASSVPMRLRITGTGYTRRPLATVTYPYQSETGDLFVLVGREETIRLDPVALVSTDPRGSALGRWRYDLTTKTHSLSEHVSRQLGYPSHERVIEDFGLSCVHPEDRDAMREIYERAIADRAPFFCRCRIIDQRGGYRLFDGYGLVEAGPKGTPQALVGVCYDITDASENIRALQSSIHELQELFAEISDFIMRADPRGYIQYISPSVTYVLGFEPKDLLQEDVERLIHPDDAELLNSTIHSLTAVGQSVVAPHRMLHRDGHWVWIEATVRALVMGPAGFPAETVSVCRDITARKRAEEELAAAYARAEAASATKSRFLANMSHELRTPLNAIIGFSDIIRREMFGPVGSARYKEYAQLIQESGGHLLDLINDILDMSKIEAGKFDLRFEPVDLEDLVRSSLKLLEPRAQQAKLLLTAEFGDSKPHIQADRRALKQILLNLLTNSIKFTPPGGIVTASLQELTDGVALQVRDTGIGISEKDLPRITLPFEQVTHDPLLAQAGSGLGLALVQSLVNLHTGTLKIDSAPGQGTLITVFLPADPRSRRAA